ncbi:hypothetical protein [Sphaerimonospora thailandensis]|nr:hypothetical protein [Sphaerimonospora thailandensis]
MPGTCAYKCPPWCTDHANGTPPGRNPHPADQLCRTVARNPAYGEITLTSDTDDGPVIWLHNTREELTPAAAEQLAYALLAQAAAAREATR